MLKRENRLIFPIGELPYNCSLEYKMVKKRSIVRGSPFYLALSVFFRDHQPN